MCQPLSGLEIELPGALEDPDEQDDEENQQEYAAADVHTRLLSVVCGRLSWSEGGMYPPVSVLTPEYLCGREDSNLQGPCGPTGPKPAASASSATPAWRLKDRAETPGRSLGRARGCVIQSPPLGNPLELVQNREP